MGADWYTPEIWYGYSFVLSSSFRSLAKQLHDIRAFVSAPFDIVGLLTTFHSRMECVSDSDLQDLDNYAVFILGFKPDNDLEKTLTHGKELAEYIQNNPILMGFTLDSKPSFFTGIDWPNGFKDGFIEELESDVEDSSEESTSDGFDTSLQSSMVLSEVASDPPTSDSLLSDHEDIDNYHEEENHHSSDSASSDRE